MKTQLKLHDQLNESLHEIETLLKLLLSSDALDDNQNIDLGQVILILIRKAQRAKHCAQALHRIDPS